jgi:hypothetical protein
MRKRLLRQDIEAAARRRKWRRLGEDVLLFPLALLLMFFDHVIWDGARALLIILSRHHAVAALRCSLQRLPPLAVVLLFLVPEIFDHLGGLWATVLLVRGQVAAAAFVAVFIKGFAALVAIWIYQSCEETLLSVPWFRRLHDRVIRWYEWVQQRTAPLRHRARGFARSGRLGRRLLLWRHRLSARFGITRP